MPLNVGQFPLGKRRGRSNRDVILSKKFEDILDRIYEQRGSLQENKNYNETLTYHYKVTSEIPEIYNAESGTK